MDNKIRSMLTGTLAGLALLGGLAPLAQAHEKARWGGGFGGGDTRSTAAVIETERPGQTAGWGGQAVRRETTATVARVEPTGRTYWPAGWGGEPARKQEGPVLMARTRSR